jgi:hypothetical protein
LPIIKKKIHFYWNFFKFITLNHWEIVGFKKEVHM